jgi:hypothetical protein
MRAPYTGNNQPNIDEREPRRKMSVIGFKKKKPEYHPHCRNHIWQRLLRVNDSFLCPVCGPSVPAMRIVEAEVEETE